MKLRDASMSVVAGKWVALMPAEMGPLVSMKNPAQFSAGINTLEVQRVAGYRDWTLMICSERVRPRISQARRR